jgi:hypothetical protein
MPGTLVISDLSDGTNSTSATNCIQGSAKAWVNFNGTGTPAIRASYNVSSITDNGTGDYTINFTNAFADANYAWMGSVGFGTTSVGDGCIVSLYGTAASFQLTSSVRVLTTDPSANSSFDQDYVGISVFR